jgi:sulfonate transport system permease protein
MLLAIGVGIPVGVVMARFRKVDWVLDTWLNALYSTPTVALVPVLVLWFGIRAEAKVVVVFLFAIFPVLINTYQGVRKVDASFLEVARSFRSSEWQMWRDVLLPWAVPYITAGIRLAIGRGLVGMIIAEFYTAMTGLGYMIVRYAHIFKMDRTFVPVILLMFLGIALTAALKWVERRIAPWNRTED